jgi:hypothetical protein
MPGPEPDLSERSIVLTPTAQMELIWKLLEHLRIDRGLPVHILVISVEDRTFTDAIVGRETTKSGTETVLAPGFGPRGSCSDQ